jgi:hypothetical protein
MTVMSRGPKSEKRPADVIGASCQNGLVRPIAQGAQRIEVKNPKAPAVTREAEEDWGR